MSGTGQSNPANSKPRGRSADLPAGLSENELASLLAHWIDDGVRYARTKRKRFSRAASWTKAASLAVSASSTIILGLQDLGFWAGLGFALGAVVTVIQAIEPFFNWRSRWVLMEEHTAKMYRLRDDLAYLIAKTPSGQLTIDQLDPIFAKYQDAWTGVSGKWLRFRRSLADGDDS